MSGKMLIAAVVVAVVYFIFGGIFYAWLMADFFEAQMPGSTEANLSLIGLMCLAYGLLMAYTYPFGYRGGSAVGEGMRFGILFALIVNLPASLSWIAMGYGTWPLMLVSMIGELVIGAILGIVVAKLYGSPAKAAVPKPA